MNKIQEAYEKMMNEGKLDERNPESGFGKNDVKLTIIEKWMKQHIAWHKKNDK